MESSTPPDRARRFLDAFHGIEQILQDRLPTEDGRPHSFTYLTQHAPGLSRTQRERLQDLTSLRNAIAHHPYTEDGIPFADPRIETVEWIEAQREIIESPPRVIHTLRLQKPRLLSHDDDVRKFLDETVSRNDHSQAPFRNRDGQLRLITTNAVARWIASRYTEANEIDLESETIGDIVASFSEHADRVLVRDKSLRTVDALNIFAGSKDHQPPAAIILTENGNEDEIPIGIASPWDIPTLAAALKV